MRDQIKRRALALSMAAVSLGTAGESASAATVYESATPASSAITSGYLVNSSNFLAVRFQLTSSTTIAEVGGQFARFSGGNGNIFGALVSLTASNDYPDSLDLSTPDVLKAGAFSTVTPSADASYKFAPVSVGPGWYALVFGSGLFGATGQAGLTNNNTTVGTPAYFKMDGTTSSYGVIGLPGSRLFATDVPEPAALSLAALAVAGIGRRRRSTV